MIEGKNAKFEVMVNDEWKEVELADITRGDIFRPVVDGAPGKIGVCTGTGEKDGKPVVNAVPYVEPESWAPQPAGLNVELVRRLRIDWKCRNPACSKMCQSYDEELFAALQAGGTPSVLAPCCGKAYRIMKQLVIGKNGHKQLDRLLGKGLVQ